MTTIAALGPEGSYSWQAARLYAPAGEIKLYNHIGALLQDFEKGAADLAVVPVYNTRTGAIKEHFALMQRLRKGCWMDNVILPITLSLGAPDGTSPLAQLVSKGSSLRQCEEYIAARYPRAAVTVVSDLAHTVETLKAGSQRDWGVIDTEESLRTHGLVVRERELAPHNRTRFAILAAALHPRTGYDATAMITTPLKDRVGLLFDILGEFAGRGVNLLDMRSETDTTTQKLSFYIEAEGHIADEGIRQAMARIETHIIQEPGSVRVLGSFPRLDLRTKRIRSVGFIGTGSMSRWFADRLENEGYQTVLTGRSTPVPPAEMIPAVNVVIVCVPISATRATIAAYGGLLRAGQALVLLAGEAENTLAEALARTDEGVEVMLIHNLWGPKAATMKDKNAAVVRTARSGPLCSELESFLYKHGASISQDSATRHDLLMGVTQKLPTEVSVALAMVLAQNGISPAELGDHATLTSLYGILAMARVHSQNPRTYAEIMASEGEGRKIARDFAANLLLVLDLADRGDIARLCSLIEENRAYLTEEFLALSMKQALAVDEVLGKIGRL